MAEHGEITEREATQNSYSKAPGRAADDSRMPLVVIQRQALRTTQGYPVKGRSPWLLACFLDWGESRQIQGQIEQVMMNLAIVSAKSTQGSETLLVVEEECEVPNRLSNWQWVNLFEEDGYERLRAIAAQRPSRNRCAR